jgi:hypothetical protein
MSTTTGALLSEYLTGGDKDRLSQDPEDYLRELWERVHGRTTGATKDPLIRQKAYQSLLQLHNGDQAILDAWNQIFQAHQLVMKNVLERMGYTVTFASNPEHITENGSHEKTTLSLDTDELIDGLKSGVPSSPHPQTWLEILEALKDGHPEAPVLNDEYHADSTPWSDDEEESDDDDDEFDSDTEENVLGSVVHPAKGIKSNFKPGIRLDLRLDQQFGIASLSHPLPAANTDHGCPTCLTVDMAAVLRRSRNGIITFNVVSWTKHHRVLLAKKCFELMGIEVGKGDLGDIAALPYTKDRILLKDIPFGRILGIETSVGDKTSGPMKWLDKAENHLKGISGKSTMVFRDDEDEEEYTSQVVEDINLNANDRSVGSSVGMEIASIGRPRSPKKPTYVAGTLAVSAMFVQVFQSRRTKDCIFDWSRVLENRKDVGLYLQYAHARLCG